MAKIVVALKNFASMNSFFHQLFLTANFFHQQLSPAYTHAHTQQGYDFACTVQ